MDLVKEVEVIVTKTEYTTPDGVKYSSYKDAILGYTQKLVKEGILVPCDDSGNPSSLMYCEVMRFGTYESMVFYKEYCKIVEISGDFTFDVSNPLEANLNPLGWYFYDTDDRIWKSKEAIAKKRIEEVTAEIDEVISTAERNEK